MTLRPDFQRALDACAAEPIHIIGGVQPPGVLLVFDRHERLIRAASANAVDLFGVAGLDDLLGQPVDAFLDQAILGPVSTLLDPGADAGTPRLAGMTNAGPQGALHEVCAHATGDLVHLEFEPRGEAPHAGDGHGVVAGLDAASGSGEFLETLARQVQALSGYSRVMVYRFLRDHTGEVVAEALDGHLASYLGLRYPASDIPPQARALYVRNRIRVIADVAHEPVPVHQHGSLAEPLDMSFDVTRAVSPVHLQYLRNMGVAASMSVSLVVDGRLWGMVACHHHEPRPVGARTRQALDMLGRHVSMILDARQLRAEARREDTLRERRDQVERLLHGARHPGRELVANLDVALAAAPADGVALHLGGSTHAHGATPDAAGLQAALHWARQQRLPGVAATQRGSDWLGDDAECSACGLLALRLGEDGDDWLLLFRREQRETVRWAGRPDQPFQIDPDGSRIGPRNSFAVWEEQVLGTAAPWTERDFELAQRLRLMLDRYLSAARPDAAATRGSDADARLCGMEAREQAARLRRLADLLAGARSGRDRLQRLHLLLSQMEEELGALADAGE